MRKYVLKQDKELPKNLRTVWYVDEPTTKTVLTFRKKAIQKKDPLYGLGKEWTKYIKKVKNYCFGTKFPDLCSQGYISFKDEKTIKKVLYDLTFQQVGEILTFAKKISDVSEAFQKKVEIGVFYYGWKAEKFSRQREYDCKNCRIFNWIEQKGRKCFLKDDKIVVPYPIFETEDSKGNRLPVARLTNDVNSRESTVDDIYNWLIEMESVWPDIPSIELLRMYLAKICIESMVDPLVTHYFRLEQAVEKYGHKILDMPYSMFESFEIIRGAQNRFENLENFKRESEMKSKTGK